MVSIVVVTYNSRLNDVLFTLKTIITQTYKDYELIISDDGSKDNHKQEICNFLKDNQYYNYKYIDNKENVGTVNHVINVLNHVNREYVKCFGAGDGFYARDSLEKLVNHIKIKTPDFVFSLMQAYTVNNNELLTFPFDMPSDIDALFYKKKRTKKNIVFLKETVSGMATLYKKTVYKQYLEYIKNVVKYVEDIILVEAFINGATYSYINDYLYLYEGGNGISTSNTPKSNSRIYNDEKAYYQYLTNKYPDDKWIKRRNRYGKLFWINNIYLRALVLSIIIPYRGWLYVKRFISKKMLNVYGPKECYSDYINEIKKYIMR